MVLKLQYNTNYPFNLLIVVWSWVLVTPAIYSSGSDGEGFKISILCAPCISTIRTIRCHTGLAPLRSPHQHFQLPVTQTVIQKFVIFGKLFVCGDCKTVLLAPLTTTLQINTVWVCKVAVSVVI